MKPNYVWIIEIDHNENGRWEPEGGQWFGTKASANSALAEWRAISQHDKFRIRKYVAEEPKK